MVEFIAYHGSVEDNLKLIKNKAFYLTDSYLLAKDFAYREVYDDGLYADEIPIVYAFKGEFKNPYYLTEEEYDEEGQDSNIDYKKWVDMGVDGIIFKNEGYATYYIVINPLSIKLIGKKYLPYDKNGLYRTDTEEDNSFDYQYPNNEYSKEINEVLKLSGVRVAETVEQPLKAPFKLPDGCPTDWFQLTNSFKDIKQWKAIVHEANSRSDESIKVGDLEEVGYVMISLTDNTIVPIARSDEHHQGYDVFTEYYASEFHLSPSKFQEVFCLPNTVNYPYSKEEAENLKKALIKCGEYGMNLKTSYVFMKYIDDNFKNKSYDEAQITAEEFINGNYGLASFGTQLTNVGERLLEAFQELSKAFENKNARGTISLPALRKAIKTLTTVGKKIPLAGGTLVRDIDKEWMDDVLEQYKQHYIDDKQLENLFFGFGGFRNRFHQILRKNVGDEKLNKLLGSVNTLVDMIGAL